MRWSEIMLEAPAYLLRSGLYRKLDRWTRAGWLKAKMRTDGHGRHRWWPPDQVAKALLMAELVHCGMSDELALRIAKATPDGRDGMRSVSLGPALTLDVVYDPTYNLA